MWKLTSWGQVGSEQSKKNTTRDHLANLPSLELRITQNCTVTLILSALTGIAADLRIIVGSTAKMLRLEGEDTVLDTSGELVANIAAGKEGAMRIPMVLNSAESPFRLLFASEDEEVLSTLDIEFECDKKLDVALVEL